MPLIKCQECSHEISNKAKSCPNCGAPNKKPTSPVTKLVLFLLVLPFVVMFLGRVVSYFPDDQSPSTYAPSSARTSPKLSLITDDDLDQVHSFIAEGRYGSAIAIAEKYELSENAELRRLHSDATEMLAASKRETADKLAAYRAAAAVRVQKTADRKATAISSDAREKIWMSRGKAAVKAQLKDPSSAQFRNIYFHRGADGIPMTCGEVNSKNSFGAYGGYQKFVSAGKSELTFLEEEVADFSNVWNSLCK